MTRSDSLNISLAQLNPTVGDLHHNKALILKAIAELPDNSDLIVFPEMVTCGYPPEDLILKPAFLRMIADMVTDIQVHTKDVNAHIALPTPWIFEDGKTYNAMLILHKGKIVHTIQKYELPNYGVFDEVRLFEQGALPTPYKINGVKLGFAICEDLWFETVSRHLHEQGARILICANASPFDNHKTSKRVSAIQARNKETGLPVIYVNQVGGQDELVFDGASFVVNEKGRVTVKARSFMEDILHTSWEIPAGKDTALICQSEKLPAGVTELETIYRAAMTGLRDYVKKNGFPGVLIGLSGGIDSALTAALAVDALGADKVECVMMPSQYTSQESLDDAEALAERLGVIYKIIPIEGIVSAANTAIEPHIEPDAPGITFENIQSRSRAVILMALSNATNKMLVSTGNKSEMAVGYATLYGDMCGGFNPIKDIYKTQVYKLCEWRNNHMPHAARGPQGNLFGDSLLTKAPSAELREDQTDQDSLPPYEDLDAILMALIEGEKSTDDIIKAGYDADVVKKVWKLLDRSEYKRRQAPPGVKMTTRAFGRERRYPITNHFVWCIDK